MSEFHSYIALLESELPEIEQRMSDVEKQVEETNQKEYSSPKGKKLLKTLNSEYFKVKLELENIDSDCLTTSYTVKLLTNIEKMGIKNFLPEIYLAKIDEVIASGLDWLRKNNEQKVL